MEFVVFLNAHLLQGCHAMRTHSLVAAAFSLAALSVSTVAQSATFGITPQVGLAGAGATVQWGFNEYLGLSAGYTGIDQRISDVKTDEATYDADISISNPQLFVNWAPFGGHFRVSFGVIAQDSTIDLVGRDFKQTPTNPNAGVVNNARINASFAQSIAPAVTVGWETPMDQVGFGYHLSIGAMYAGDPEVNANITCNVVASCLGLQRDEERDIEDELSKYKVLPILQAGVLYRL